MEHIFYRSLFKDSSQSSRGTHGRIEEIVIDAEKGRGSYGSVHIGTYRQQYVAIKRMHRVLLQAEDNSRLIKAFEREGERLRSLNHPNIVKCLAFHWNRELNEPLLIMEMMGENLAQYMKRCKDEITEGRQIEISLEIAKGIQYIHGLDQPLVHRDLKLENILLSYGDEVKIGDFGQAKILDSVGQVMNSTQPGTVAYMPPEALKKEPEYSVKIDVFSHGVIMLCLATQKEPTVSLIGIGVVSEIQRRADDIALLSEDHALKPLIISCLQDDSKIRPDINAVHRQLTLLKGGIEESNLRKRIESLEDEVTKCKKQKTDVRCKLLETVTHMQQEIQAMQVSMTDNNRMQAQRLENTQKVLIEDLETKLLRLSGRSTLVPTRDDKIAQKFLDAWQREYGGKIKREDGPPKKADIKGIFRVKSTALEEKFTAYSQTLSSPNITWYFHGTVLKCDILNNKSLCSKDDCSVCGICHWGFDPEKIGSHVGYQRLGQAFYLGADSGNFHTFTEGHLGVRAVLYCQVVAGKSYEPKAVSEDLREMKIPPAGYNSVVAKDPCIDEVYDIEGEEIALFREDAILPCYVVVYEWQGIRLLTGKQ